MRFLIYLVVNYDPHHVISNRRKALKRKLFKHEKIVVLADVANWSDYPKEAPKDVDMHEDSNSPIREVVSLFPDISKLISAVDNITPLASHSERTNKRVFSYKMDTGEEDTARTPKNKNT